MEEHTNEFLKLYRTYRPVVRRLLSGVLLLLLLFPMFAVKSCSAAGNHDASPATYSWFGMLCRSRDFDWIAACLPIAVILLFIISSVIIKKLSLLPLFLELFSFLTAALAGATLVFYPSLAFLFDSIQYKPAFFAAAIIPPLLAADSAFRAVDFLRNAMPEDAHQKRLAVHIRFIRVVNIAAAVLWLPLPLLGTAPEKNAAKDIAAMAVFLVMFWTPFLLMQITANKALKYREKWPYISSAVTAAVSFTCVVLLAAGMIHHG